MTTSNLTWAYMRVAARRRRRCRAAAAQPSALIMPPRPAPPQSTSDGWLRTLNSPRRTSSRNAGACASLQRSGRAHVNAQFLCFWFTALVSSAVLILEVTQHICPAQTLHLTRAVRPPAPAAPRCVRR
jgi:hypothetical protein